MFAAALGCTDSSGPNLAPCDGAVTVAITANALQPVFSWSPNCLIDQISVEEVLPPSAGGNRVTWILTARTPGQGVGAPLRYGTVPTGMQEFLHAESLAFQHQYHVRVYGGGAALGGTSFIPPYPPD